MSNYRNLEDDNAPITTIKQQNFNKLIEALGNIEFTNEEKGSLEWLAGWERDSIKNICSVIEKAKEKVKNDIIERR